jgi:hypothetical protein
LCEALGCGAVLAADIKAAEPPPSIRFLRPLVDERFFDYPIFVQVQVSNFHLVPPEPHPARRAQPNTGHIAYSLDDYPVYSTDDTQLMIGKKVGTSYLPVGLHVLKAQLVDVNGHPLNPLVAVETEVFTGHPAAVEVIHTPGGPQQAELTGQELYKMNVLLEDVQKEITKLENGTAGYSPTPSAASSQE